MCVYLACYRTCEIFTFLDGIILRRVVVVVVVVVVVLTVGVAGYSAYIEERAISSFYVHGRPMLWQR